MSFLNKLFAKLKPKAAPPKESLPEPEKEPVKNPSEESRLNEEMVSEGVEMEPKEDDGFSKIFEQAGDKKEEEGPSTEEK